MEALGLDSKNIHELDVPAEDRAHYSKKTIDIEYDFPIGKEELMGIAYRTDFDLMNIQRVSGKSMEYTIKGTNEKFVPHVIEPSFGVERALMAVFVECLSRGRAERQQACLFGASRNILAPVKFAVSSRYLRINRNWWRRRVKFTPTYLRKILDVLCGMTMEHR